ncbi:hypothetical protein JYT48_02405 [Mariprofundus ferrooxydans]|nr:hypothetical protein [Mariprofundus ferrooxydans]MBN4077102.1 hypothetical protein [Mariprofundus ferrooxydans]
MVLSNVIFWVLAVGALAIAIAGVRDRVVIYYDKKDFWVSFLPWAVYFAGIIAVGQTQPGVPVDFKALTGEQTTILQITGIIAFVVFVEVTRRSIKYNRSFPIGGVVLVFKVIFAIVAVVGSLAAMGRLMEGKSTIFIRVKGLFICNYSAPIINAGFLSSNSILRA